jgi:PAS domain S-box-containing protein
MKLFKILRNKINSLKCFQKKCNIFTYDPVARNISKQYKEIFENNYIISKTDENGLITYANAEFLRLHCTTLPKILGKTHKIVKHPDTPKETYDDLWTTVLAGKIWHGQIAFYDCEKNTRWSLVSIFPIFKDGKIIEFLTLRQEITDLVEMENALKDAQQEIIINLGSIIENKNGDLKTHIERVAEYSHILAKAYGLDAAHASAIKIASPMHDSGKVGISDEILDAPRKLTQEEFEIIKTHPGIGYSLFKNSKLEILKIAALISYHHHEKWDGSGYPQGLKGFEISIEGRIAAIADVFDALATHRVYKDAWAIEEIDDYFQKESGISFDPDLIDLYFKNKQKFLNVMKKYS